MKKLITILFLLPISVSAQFKSKKEAEKYSKTIEIPYTIDSSYKKNTLVKYHFTIRDMIENRTGKKVSILFELYKDGHWTEKIIKWKN